jgi:hypothetical protein
VMPRSALVRIVVVAAELSLVEFGSVPDDDTVAVFAIDPVALDATR